ncbi:MAG: MarR family winged helix-turn-helix transcriptional regulator [Alphaproteobacteria bacterium]
MTDIKKDSPEIRKTIEMLYFAYRGFTGVADEVLVKHDLGRAHHRAIYFVGRNPNIIFSDLMKTLKITKQSLNRVLSTLIYDEFIEQITDKKDKRKKLLRLTEKGVALEKKLTNAQAQYLRKVFDDKDELSQFQNILLNMMHSQDKKSLTK